MTATRAALLELATRVEQASGPDRFWSKVDAGGGEDACWNWTASKNQFGYGQFSTGSRVAGTYRMVRAHRYAYSLLCGALAPDQSLDHLCRNKACVNPKHLEIVSTAENNRRAAAARKHCKNGHLWVAENLMNGRVTMDEWLNDIIPPPPSQEG